MRAGREGTGTRVGAISVKGAVAVGGALLLFLAGGLWLAWRPGNERDTSAGVNGTDPVVSEGTRRMAARLRSLVEKLDPDRNPFLNRQRVAMLQAQLAEGVSSDRRLELKAMLGKELLRAGRSEEAARVFLDVLALAEGIGAREQREYYELMAFHLLGMSYLRLGEQENCVSRHGPDSCLLPLRGDGIHTVTRGSRLAVRYFTRALEREPRSLDAAWLLNIASMTLGEYPDKVPGQWRIPPDVFLSDHDIGRFPNVAARAGVDVMGLSGGAIVEDLDRDGWLDIVASSWGFDDPLRFFRNRGDGTFEDRSREAALDGIVGGLNICHADYDNDGYSDVLVLRGAWMFADGRQPNSLLHNNGDGTFSDVTEEAGVLSFHPTQTAAWGDFDNDGWLDLYVGNESAGDERHPCELFRNNGDGTFTECASVHGVANVGYVKAVAWGDYNNDGRLDLYLSRLDEPNVLYRNDGPVPGGASAGGAPRWRFTDVSREAGVTEPRLSFPAWFFDFDNDGWLDLFVADYAWDAAPAEQAADYLGIRRGGESSRLFRNRGDGTFEDVTRRAGLWKAFQAMGANYGDLDNDGWLDLYVGTGEPAFQALVPNRMFRNAGDGRFQDVTTSGGFGHLQKGHGIAFGDTDGDGDQDVYAVMGGAYTGDGFQNVLFENPGHGNHWITLQFQGVRSNRMGVGVRVRMEIEESGRRREIHVTVSTGGSFGSSSLQQEIGVGRADVIPHLEVTWPVTGESQVFEDVPVDRVLRIREGDETYEVVERRSASS